MTRVLTAAALLLTFAVPAAAQTKGRVSVGGTVTYVKPTDGEVGPLVGFGGLVRLKPKKGWGFAGGLGWFRAEAYATEMDGRTYYTVRRLPGSSADYTPKEAQVGFMVARATFTSGSMPDVLRPSAPQRGHSQTAGTSASTDMVISKECPREHR